MVFRSFFAFSVVPFQLSSAVPELRVGGYPGPLGETALQLWADWANANPDTAKHTVALDLGAYNADTYLADIEANMANWDIVIPPYGSGPSGNVVTTVDGAKPILVWGGAAENIFEHEGAVGDKVFGTLTPASHYFDSGLQAVYDSGARTVVYVENDSSFSASICVGARAKATSLGMTNSGDFSYARTDDDAAITTKTAEVAVAAADVTVNCGHEEDTVRVNIGLNAASYCPKALIATNSITASALGRYTGDNAALPQGVMMPSQWSILSANPDDPITGWSDTEFVAAYNTLKGDSVGPSYHAASALLTGLAVTKAMQSLTADDYVEVDFVGAMRTVDVTTVVGRVKFSATNPRGANTEKPMVTEQKQTNTEIVAPCSVKTRDPEYPRQCAGGTASPSSPTACSAIPGSTGSTVADVTDSFAHAGASPVLLLTALSSVGAMLV